MTKNFYRIPTVCRLVHELDQPADHLVFRHGAFEFRADLRGLQHGLRREPAQTT